MTVAFAPERIEQWPLARLQPYAKNAKLHGADQVAKIAASMAEFGWTVPCLVGEDGELIAGHGRVLAATQLGLTEAPVIVLGHLTEAQRRAYRIADNKLTELGGWDEALLLEELRGLMAEDFDLGLIGIPEAELDALLHDADDRAPIDDDAADAIPEAPADPITRPGDLWICGTHRVLCGDATKLEDVKRALGEGRLAVDPRGHRAGEVIEGAHDRIECRIARRHTGERGLRHFGRRHFAAAYQIGEREAVQVVVFREGQRHAWKLPARACHG